MSCVCRLLINEDEDDDDDDDDGVWCRLLVAPTTLRGHLASTTFAGNSTASIACTTIRTSTCGRVRVLRRTWAPSARRPGKAWMSAVGLDWPPFLQRFPAFSRNQLSAPAASSAVEMSSRHNHEHRYIASAWLNVYLQWRFTIIIITDYDVKYEHTPIGKVWIYRLLFFCLCVCLYGYGFLHWW